MASQGDGVPVCGAVEVVEQDVEKPSPSQTLLQRIKSLREWQEKQREELMQVLSHSMPHKASTLTPLKEETPTQLSESMATEDATPKHLVPHTEGPHATVGLPGVEAASSVVTAHPQQSIKPPQSFPEEVLSQTRQTTLRDQLSDNHDSREIDPMIVTGQANHPIEAHTMEYETSPLTSTGPSVACDTSDPGHNDEGERTVAEVECGTPQATDTQERTQDSAFISPQDPNDYMDQSMEDLFGLEKQKPYRSDKYKSPAPSQECVSKGTTYSSQAMKDFAPSKSFFSSMTQGPEGGGVDETPRPRYRFLKKGQGTSRFGMKPVRLKRMSNTEPPDESSILPHAAIQNTAQDSPTVSPAALTPTKRQFRLPMRTLKLQEVSQRGRTSVGEQMNTVNLPVRHKPSPVLLASTEATPQHSATPSPRSEKQQRKEQEELSAFERLEELAEDSSFSSNSSTVWHLLKQGQQSASSTPLRTPPPLAFQETPVVGSLGAESQFLIGHLINRMTSPRNGPSSQQQQVAVDVKEVLAQLKSIVRLEGHSISDVTESDIQTFLEGYSTQDPHNAPHPTSTPLSPQPSSAGAHHVHFASQGVQVLEYELSDTEEDTLTEATSIDSDLITTSDLEALIHRNVRGGSGVPHRQQQTKPSQESNEGNSSSSSEVTLTEQEEAQGREPVVLTFSPPPPRPAQSASNYIWSIFGKERDARKQSAPKGAPKQVKKSTHQQPSLKPQETEQRSVASAPQPGTDTQANQEVEIHKTLLLAKVAELEKETNLFKKENSKLQKLQQQAQEERQKVEKEKHRLQEEAITERRKFQEYVDRERNALWKEKQLVFQRPAPVSQPPEHMMEVVRLREQIREFREETERKESLNQFAVKKLNDRIRTLENENKKLKEKNNSLQALEKENQDLRLKVDRARAGGRTRTVTQPSKPTRGRPKSGTRSTTVDGVAKAIDKMTKPQPVIVKEAQSKASQATKTKQDLANNNVDIRATESDDVLTGSNTRAESCQASPPVLKDTPDKEEDPTSSPGGHPRPSQAPLPMWASLGCTEEAGLEHTERTREDGIREVIYANGNRKEIHPSGKVTISYYNGDRKEVHGDRTVYVYGSDHTSHTTYSSGKEEFVFPNGQLETRHPDGSSAISFPNGSRKTVLSDGTEICTTKDGSIVRTNPDGSQVFEFPSGQREVHRAGEKRREYPDGTVKILHPDGRTETRYSSGRIRIKDREGNLILDTHVDLSSPLHP